MADGDEDILGDPLFQLNVALWMLHPHAGHAPVRAALYEAGYLLHSFGRTLPVPFGKQEAVNELVQKGKGHPDPDLIAERLAGDPYLLIECKRSSFGPDSTTADQAIKLLAIAEDLSDPLAVPAGTGAMVTYLVRAPQHDGMADTLTTLQSRLSANGLGHGDGAALGLSRQDDGVYVRWSDRAGVPPGAETIADAPVLKVPADEDPRPLYFLPWDPGVEQSEEMSEFCKGLLFEQLRVLALAEVGRAEPPQRLELDMRALLNLACSGLLGKWRKKEDVRRVVDAALTFLIETLKPLAQQLKLIREENHLGLTLGSEAVQRGVIERLQKSDPEEVELAEYPQLPLGFDGE